ncbi:hypothetical protein F8M41_021561 [Gigaspora margarita]|uniref:Uncharacterized protein n=1 Tax=Gigaspora margarita TaxID=4874 RepID=A0A8H4AGM3_GIGMA|nr:hypothetical protein F8M41_021561 [Gigaspora margarita]
MSLYTDSSISNFSRNVSFSNVQQEQSLQCNFYRNPWCDKGEFSEKAKWEERERKVIIYELPSLPHEVCISAIVEEINVDCSAARSTNAKVVGLGTTRGPLGKLVEMAYSETLDHVEEALYYLLSPGRAHCKNRSGSQRRNVCPYENRRTRSNIPAKTMIVSILKAGSTIQNPRELLLDPIPIDFFLVRLALKVAIA